MLRHFTKIFILLTTICFFYPVKLFAATNGPLRKSSNPSYFMDASGKAVFLSGQHTWWNFWASNANVPPGGDYNAYFTELANKGQNFARIWSGDDPPTSFEPYNGISPVTKPLQIWNSGPSCCNSAYFARLASLADAAKAKGIYVSFMFFEGWWQGEGPPQWGTALWPYHKFYSLSPNDMHVLYTERNSTIFNLQKQFIAQAVSTLSGKDNVIFEICNECHNAYRSDNTQWQKDLINYIHSLNPSAIVGFTGNADSNTNENMLTSNADWVSLEGAEYLDPPKADTRKISILDTDHIQCANTGCTTDDAWVWKALTRGHNAILMDDWRAQGYNIEPSRNSLGPAVWMANTKVKNLLGMHPNAAPCNTSYCLGNGSEMVAYYPSGTSNPNLGSGWTYELFSTTSTTPGSGNKVVYASNGSVVTPPTNTPTTIRPGDANTDGRVDGLDFTIWKNEYINHTGLNSDFNNSGSVEGTDFAIWKTAYQKG